jgi:Nif-specific regulatory protein
LTDALPTILLAAGGSFVAVAEPGDRRWTSVAEAGARQTLPGELLAEVLDREEGAIQGDWVALPLGVTKGATQAIAFRCAPGTHAHAAMPMLTALASLLAEQLQTIAVRSQDRQRIRRLSTILEIAQQWNRTRELEPLLVRMAEAACQLLDADRASIFLWDRRAHVLIGRPALGVPGGELRIADDRGVVGGVIQSGQPCRVDAATEPRRIDHKVDDELGYRTRNILCVPLRGKSGELFGAFELLNKRSGNFTADDEAALVELAAHAAVALENAQDRQELLSASRQMAEQAAQQVQLIGKSPKIEALRSIIRRVADTELAVLILGENGTGKEVVAQSIHYLSRRRDKPFVAVNCAAIPDTLAESELFGHEKGAFTDASETRRGKFELAAAGTLFLDEIGDLSLSGQAKLLRVVEERVLVRVGGSTPIPTEARILAATNQNLADMVRQKRFREDLYYRLNVVTVEIPPLRDRAEDIVILAEHFLTDFSKRARRKVPEITPAARQRLQAHGWPGNVRELRNLMERLAYLSAEDRVDADDLAFILAPREAAAGLADFTQPLSDATAQFQVDCIHRAIQRCGGNMSHAADQLGLHRSNLYRKMRQLNMPIPGHHLEDD